MHPCGNARYVNAAIHWGLRCACAVSPIAYSFQKEGDPCVFTPIGGQALRTGTLVSQQNGDPGPELGEGAGGPSRQNAR